ncbi:hypothetical protein HGRIS_009065 [Hohenbuehelia grisea]|uniref:Pentatricopeptide repeat protein n=1 Tax=Hohenbuehelia grisea TaxID=104357 RepID=A0ABR3J0F6_9AGAR
MNLSFRYWKPVSLIRSLYRRVPNRHFHLSTPNFLASNRRHATNKEVRARQQKELSKINGLLASINRLVNHDQDERTTRSFIHAQLSLPEFQSPLRHVTFERIILCLLQGRYVSTAVSVYQRMAQEEDLMPSAELNVAVMAVCLGTVEGDTPAMREALEEALADRNYPEKSLLRLLNLLLDLDFPPEFRLYLAKHYIEVRGPIFSPSAALVAKIIRLHAQSGSLQEAIDWLDRDEPESETEEAPGGLDESQARLYSSMLAGLRDAGAAEGTTVDSVLQHMKDHNVPATTSVFNALISLEVRRGMLDKAFALYRVLTSLGSSWLITPDDCTFGTLFTALQHANSKNMRNARSRRYKSSKDVVMPRELFRDLISVHHQGPPNPVITLSVLNVALRTFLSVHDYAASFVALRTFTILGLHPNLRTYYIVMKQLMDRIRYDTWRIRQKGESRWGDHMLGIRWDAAAKVKVDSELAQSILNYGENPLPPVDRRPSKGARDQSDTFVPTIAQIDGDEPLPLNRLLHAQPLMRIMRRAILADVDWQRGQVAANDDEFEPVSRAVSSAILGAKAEMLPEETKMRKRDRRKKI